MYFIIDALLAVKLSEMVADFSRRAKLLPSHYDVPNLSSDVHCIVIALQERCPIDLLVCLALEKGCNSSFGFRIAIKGNRSVAVCDRMDCYNTRSPVLGNFLGGTICASDAGNEVKSQIRARLVS
jgi:hypothetical protein